MSRKKKCLIWINRLAGSYKKLNEKKIIAVFAKNHDVSIRYVQNPGESIGNIQGFDRVVACGGDGTLYTLINTPNPNNSQLIFCPFGTMNEKFKGAKSSVFHFDKLSDINNQVFSYVCAAGSFTPLGYTVQSKIKKKFKVLAYLFKVIKEYKVANIFATVRIDDIEYEDNYSLIMMIDSPRCFGFRFNRMFKPNDDDMHILLIRSPGPDNFKNRVKMFFPFFRAFFVGFGKEYESDNIIFKPFNHASLTFNEDMVFCSDGEKVVFPRGTLDVKRITINPGVTIYSRKTISKLHRIKATL